VAEDIAVFSREFKIALASIVLCTCAELFLIAPRPFGASGVTYEADFFDEGADLVDFDQAESVFVDRDEADFLDEEQAKEVVLTESDSTIQLPSMTITPGNLGCLLW
jgi:hypothetical protein